MRRLSLLLLAGFVALLAVAVLILGAFPPRAHREHVEHVVPNTHFQANPPP